MIGEQKEYPLDFDLFSKKYYQLRRSGVKKKFLDILDLDLEDISNLRFYHDKKLVTDYKTLVKIFYDKYFKTTYRVQKITLDAIMEYFLYTYGKFNCDYEDIKKVSAFNIPIKKTDKKRSAKLMTAKLESKPAFTYMVISNDNNLLTASEYAHEIAHALIERHKNAYKYYHNQEVISIFIELLFSKYIDDLNISNINLVDLRKKLRDYFTFQNLTLMKNNEVNTQDDYITDLGNSVYVNSTVEALELFKLYINDERNQTLIKRLINDIFNGNNQVEDLLDYYDLNYYQMYTNNKYKTFSKKMW